MVYHDVPLVTTYCNLTDSLSGDLAEFGVYRGDSAKLILQQTTHGTLYLYDTFTGIPAEMTTAIDHQPIGTFKDTSAEFVRHVLAEYADRVVIRPGLFPETAVDEGPFRFVHLDCDQYLSVKAGLEWFAPRMVINGVILVDDYLCGSTPGAKAAVSEFRKATGDAYELTCINYRGILRRVETAVPV